MDTSGIITNVPYDALIVGQSASMEKKITNEDITLFACLTGDINPVHFDMEYAKTTRFKTRIAHGMLGGSLVSAVLGMQLPGTGTIYLSQSLNFCYPVYLDDIITVTVTVKEKKEKNKVVLDCICTNQNGRVVIQGEAEVIAPADKITCKVTNLPKIKLLDPV
ncbi:MAG: pta 1 [Burkholderiales bacterium]|jgi:acyl dehydratase|nr:pta 1 [Burkholderiales bacterium]